VETGDDSVVAHRDVYTAISELAVSHLVTARGWFCCHHGNKAKSFLSTLHARRLPQTPPCRASFATVPILPRHRLRRKWNARTDPLERTKGHQTQKDDGLGTVRQANIESSPVWDMFGKLMRFAVTKTN